MSRPTRVLAALAAGALSVAVLAGCATVDARPAAAPAPVATADPFAAGGLQDPNPRSVTTTTATPVSVSIPSIGVDSTLESLGIGASGELEAPVDFDLAGWYAGGVVPGAIGPAIIAGHVDSVTAPAVFSRIGELADGAEILVSMSDATVLTFVVTGSAQSAKSNFPSDAVYSNVPAPELRLITCAGSFDSSIGHYTDNLIVFAALRP
ncbi:class F sortase [Microbacterium aoyamense]|uniref:Class F sortase n=1 Tax=Microbacterium aoyamense TaxID=344166 RepID=A0ABN2P7M4_9MICO|nr:class F sortase [Microbacterium aoyamense]